MQTKFKKGDRVEVVDRLHPFYGWTGKVQTQIDGEWVRVDFDNGQCIDVHRDLIVKYVRSIPASTRLASDMTIRERFAMAAMQGMYASGNWSGEFIQDAVIAADALINALNENP